MNSVGSSSRIADAGNTPSVIGTVTDLPVRSSVIVMVSGTLLPSCRETAIPMPPTRLRAPTVACDKSVTVSAQVAPADWPKSRDRLPRRQAAVSRLN